MSGPPVQLRQSEMHRLALSMKMAPLAGAAGRNRSSVLPAASAAAQNPALTATVYSPYSTDKRPSFFGSLIKNLKEEYTKSQEMQESLKKFREDAQKLEESDALKEVTFFLDLEELLV